MSENIAQKINSPGIDREHLVIMFNNKLQIVLQVNSHVCKQLVQVWLAVRKYNHIISIAEIVLYALLFLDPVIEIGKVEICEVLAQVVPDGEAIGTVNNSIEEPEEI